MKQLGKLNSGRLMQDNVIKNIKFTQAEIKILSCFAFHITKSKSIGTILGSSPKTIDTHIDNIKRKISINNKEDIYFFIKNSNQFNQLKIIFNQQYITHKYKEVVKKIYYKLKTLSLICNFHVSTELENNTEINIISQAIKLAGIKINNINNLPSLQNIYSNQKPNQFYLFIAQNIDEMMYLQEHIKNLGQNIIYICFSKPFGKADPLKNTALLQNSELVEKIPVFFVIIMLLNQTTC